ncbi:AtpZ/AtpI family protein [Estrella lausannensis]|uniref:Conserved putative membrane protein n=1 Tax=Estrella lausannensis TaxID=483423 RepID=A0A0H5DQK2_9BACT|nr:AtpZ/AtpI family protein [Estrella lausannensis]CRX38936.1 Conserved putative membrane protein [Estrella lausannensis]
MAFFRKGTDQGENEVSARFAAFVTIPFVLAVPPICGLLLGKFLDNLLGTKPYLMLSLLALGFVAAFREFYRLVKKFGDKE